MTRPTAMSCFFPGKLSHVFLFCLPSEPGSKTQVFLESLGVQVAVYFNSPLRVLHWAFDVFFCLFHSTSFYIILLFIYFHQYFHLLFFGTGRSRDPNPSQSF